MNGFLAALWAEILKVRRARITWLLALGFMILPLAGGFFMAILKNPEQARAWGLISAKAQLTAGTADWQSFFGMMAQGSAAGGAILFSLLTAWIFGREFSDHTAKELLALPTPRWTIVAAKFVVIGLWSLVVTLVVFVFALGVGWAVDIPGWSVGLAWVSFVVVLLTVVLTFMLMGFVAFFAGLGRGYLGPVGWTIAALFAANLLSVLGWGDWFPWAIPVLVSGMVKSSASQIGLHSYLAVLLVCCLGLVATFTWWQRADQTR